MTDHSKHHLLRAVVLAGCGLAVGWAIVGTWLWSSIADAVTLPRNPS